MGKDIGEELSEAATHLKEYRQPCSRSHLFQFGLPGIEKWLPGASSYMQKTSDAGDNITANFWIFRQI